MSCNLDLIISSIVLNYLNKIDKSIGNLFQKKTNALTLAKGSPVIKEIFNHFIQTNSKSRKIKFNAIGDDEHTSSDDEDIPQINLVNSNSFKPIKVETNLSDASESESDSKSSKKKDRDNVQTEKSGLSKEVVSETQQSMQQQNKDSSVIGDYFIDLNPSNIQLDPPMNNEYSGNSTTFAETNMRNSFDNYFDHTIQPHHRYTNKRNSEDDGGRAYYRRRGNYRGRKYDNYKNRDFHGTKGNKKNFKQTETQKSKKK